MGLGEFIEGASMLDALASQVKCRRGEKKSIYPYIFLILFQRHKHIGPFNLLLISTNYINIIFPLLHHCKGSNR
jgi:hypothetical protein